MGDPAGIGPEVAVRACFRRRLRRSFRPVLVGDGGVFHDAADRWAPGLFRGPGAPEILEVAELGKSDRRPGRPARRGVEAAYDSILEAVSLVRRGEADAVVTAPVSKEAIRKLGHDFPGHTEWIARLAGGANVRMMMTGATLRVVLVTTHVALASVAGALTVERVVETATIAADALKRSFGIRRPRLALAGLNPHAGEGGAFGDEEKRILRPAVNRLRRRRVRIDGPLSPDTVFFHARQGLFDAVVCLYHDQGLIPFKLVHFSDGVNVTLGLPFPRTSPDHGTAYDLAGRGEADPTSMANAVRLAVQMAGK